jgi:uncharacterized membrane protein
MASRIGSRLQGERLDMSLPPIHPAFVHLPLGLVTVSFLADVFARITKRASLRDIGFWTLAVALVGGVITIAAGYWDMDHAALNGKTDGYVHLHLKIGWILAVALMVLTIWRWGIRQRASFASGGYLAVAFLAFALTLFQGWFGGEMVYSHGAGVAAVGQGTEPAAKAQSRLARVKRVLEPGKADVGAPGHGSHTETGGGRK